jgi:hypothetical protein
VITVTLFSPASTQSTRIGAMMITGVICRIIR